MTDLARLSLDDAVTIRRETPAPLKKQFEIFRVQRVHKSPKNVSDDGLENAPPTRAGNLAQIRPVVGLIPLWSQKLNSWRCTQSPQTRLRGQIPC